MVNGKKATSAMTMREFEEIRGDLFKALKIAEVYDGRVYGGFVRNVLLPYCIGSLKEVQYKDLDIWFTNLKKVKQFVQDMNNSFTSFEIDTSYVPTLKEQMDSGYPFLRQRYRLFQEYFYANEAAAREALGNFFDLEQLVKVNNKLRVLRFIGVFDLIINKELPVNDFFENTVTVTLNSEPFRIRDLTTWLIISATDIRVVSIKAKKVHMMLEYSELFAANNADDKIKGRMIIAKDRIQRRYIDLGWTVMMPDTPRNDPEGPYHSLNDRVGGAMTVRMYKTCPMTGMFSSNNNISPNTQAQIANLRATIKTLEQTIANLEQSCPIDISVQKWLQDKGVVYPPANEKSTNLLN